MHSSVEVLTDGFYFSIQSTNELFVVFSIYTRSKHTICYMINNSIDTWQLLHPLWKKKEKKKKLLAHSVIKIQPKECESSFKMLAPFRGIKHLCFHRQFLAHTHTSFKKTHICTNYYSSSQPQVHLLRESAGSSSCPLSDLLLHLLQLLLLILTLRPPTFPPSLIDLTTWHFTFLLLTSPPPPPPPPYLCSLYFPMHHLSLLLHSPHPLSLSSGPGLRHR